MEIEKRGCVGRQQNIRMGKLWRSLGAVLSHGILHEDGLWNETDLDVAPTLLLLLYNLGYVSVLFLAPESSSAKGA